MASSYALITWNPFSSLNSTATSKKYTTASFQELSTLNNRTQFFSSLQYNHNFRSGSRFFWKYGESFNLVALSSSNGNWVEVEAGAPKEYKDDEFIVVNFTGLCLSKTLKRSIFADLFLPDALLQYSGPSKDALAYVEWLKEDHRFSDILVQISPAISGHAFPKLKLRYKPSLVQASYYSIDPLANVDREKTDILMYCTGGIRCDVYSTILRQQGFKRLYTLKGGVSHYLESEGSVGWVGNLFVFDARLSLPPSAYKAEISAEASGEQEMSHAFAKCYICESQVSELRHRNCANLDCNLLFLCCLKCVDDFRGCCCMKCTSAPRLRPVLPGHQRYRKWHTYRDLELQGSIRTTGPFLAGYLQDNTLVMAGTTRHEILGVLTLNRTQMG
ncbi:UNVERIFIED_CONTAM: Rhodanese-like domain-containing protein 8, chloroplastic [Sesamum calycinum]|uniref:Rhodanese-like domain-containing protein 8, chloroplastic n=1 Tax=Sesamum calycinum TaxID=2727403 RepID=A0AAW2PN29_9LAMI